MNPLWGELAGGIVLLLMITFIGIWIWAWRKRHQRVFRRMARLPMEDDEADARSDARTDAGKAQENRP